MTEANQKLTSITQSGTINCNSTAAPIPYGPGQTLFITLSNPNAVGSVDYTVFNGKTDHVFDKGTLGHGGSKQVQLPQQNFPDSARIHNTSACDVSGITPQLDYSATTEG